MTVYVTKPSVNLREKLSELELQTGMAGRELLAAQSSYDRAQIAGAGLYNFIRNGDFSIAQRGTSFSFSPNAGAYTLDGWYVDEQAGAEVSLDRTAESIRDRDQIFKYGMKLTVDVADTSISGSEYGMITHKVEGHIIRHLGWGTQFGRPVTLQFWHKHSVGGTYCVNIRNSSANRTFIREYVQSVPDQWEKTVVTFPACQDGPWEYGNLTGFRVDFVYANGTTYQNNTKDQWLAGTYYHGTPQQSNLLSAANNTFQLAGVQLVEGMHEDGVPWLPRNPQEELAFNQRYLYVLNDVTDQHNFVGSNYTANTTYYKAQYPVQMRADPATTSTMLVNAYSAGQTIASQASVTVNNVSQLSAQLENPISGTAGNVSHVDWHSGSIYFRAEL